MAFKALNFMPNEMVGERKVKALAENAEWLFKNTPRAVYTLPGGLLRQEGVKQASGRCVIPKQNRDAAGVEVRFGNFFSTACEPNITTGIVSVGEYRVHCVINGIGRTIPDHTGFRAVIGIDADSKAKDLILRATYVSWHAVGY